MSIKKKFSLAIVDVEKIEEINKIVINHASNVQQYSSYLYFNLNPIHSDEVFMDITFFQLNSENESSLNKELNDLMDELNQLNTGYAIRDENTHEMIVEIEHVVALFIKFDNLEYVKEGTYEKIDALNYLKTEFGICKSYNPNFRPIENTPIGDKEVRPESIYLFADTAEDLSKLKELISEKILEIDPNFEIEFAPCIFID